MRCHSTDLSQLGALDSRLSSLPAPAPATSLVLGIKNRGVISETASHRGRLGLMRENGTVSLLELCFISNPNDLKAYHAKKNVLAKEIAKILVRYESLI